MGDFRNFIEGSFRGGGAGGAFGKTGNFGRNNDGFLSSSRGDKGMGTDMSSRDGNKFQSFRNRVETGRQMEPKIIEALRAAGWKVNPSKPGQDMRQKIDAWVERGGKWLPMQIKYRDSGDEIAMECIQDWHPTVFDQTLVFNGRDMVGGSKLYACLNQSGNLIRVCSADEAKDAAQNCVRVLQKDFLAIRKRVASTPKGEARITGDPSSGRAKIMAFIKPSALTSMEAIKVPGEKSLWAA